MHTEKDIKIIPRALRELAFLYTWAGNIHKEFTQGQSEYCLLDIEVESQSSWKSSI